MSKQHRDIINAERHDLKGFEDASLSTIPFKNHLGIFEWISSNNVQGTQGPQGEQGPAVNFFNQLIVQKNPQSGQFSSIKAAVDSITDASATNRYEICIGPGIYDEQAIVLKEYIELRGIGRESVIINGLNNSTHLITGAHNCHITDLTICFSDSSGTGSALLYLGSTGASNTQAFYATNIRFGTSDILCRVESTNSFCQIHLRDFDFGGSYTSSQFNHGFQSIRNGGGKPRLIMQNGRPTQQTTPRCNTLFYASGSGADLVLSNCFANSGGNYDNGDSVGAGTLSQYCFRVEDGASLRVSGGTARGYETCVYIPNIGSAPSINIQGLYVDRNQYDFDISHPSTTGNILVQATRNKILPVASTDLSFFLIDIETGQQGILNFGKFLVAPGGDLTGAFDLAYLGKYSTNVGRYEGGDITEPGGLFIDVAAGRGYYYDVGSDKLREVVWTEQLNQAVSANSDVYVTINSAGAVIFTSSISATENTILLGRIVTNSTGIEIRENLPVNGIFGLNKLIDFHRKTFKCVYESGSTVVENGTVSYNLDVGSGVRWFMGNDITTSGGAQQTFTQVYRDGSGGWAKTSLQTVNNSHYDDGTGTLAAITPTLYSCRYLYIVGSDSDGTEKYYLQLGQAEYASLTLAQEEAPPTPPSWLKDGSVIIAQIVVKQGGSTTITADGSITPLKPTLGGASAGGAGGGTNDHGNLIGLGDDDHLQYILVDGSRAFTGPISFGGNNQTSVGTINGVTIELHGSRHLPNGADPITTASGVTLASDGDNSIGNANSLAVSNHTHKLTVPYKGGTEVKLQLALDLNHSAGKLSGTEVTPNGTTPTNIDIAAGWVAIRETASVTGKLWKYYFTGATDQALTANSNNYIYIDWNSGNPTLQILTTKSTDIHTKAYLGKVYYDGTNSILHIASYDATEVSNHAAEMAEILGEFAPYRYTDGLITEVGTRNFAIAASNWTHKLKRWSQGAFNTQTTDNFFYYYDRSAWTYTASVTQISNSQYDNAGTLTAMTTGYYRVDDIYLEPEDGDIAVIYGNAEYATLSEAKAQAILTESQLPDALMGHGKLIGRVVIKEGASAFSLLLNSNVDTLVTQLTDADLSYHYVPDTVDDPISSPTYVQVASMTVTPVAGIWDIVFSASGNSDANAADAEYIIYVGGSPIADTHRNLNYNGGAAFSGADVGLHTDLITTLNGSQAVAVYARVNTGNFTIHARSLKLIKIGNA